MLTELAEKKYLASTSPATKITSAKINQELKWPMHSMNASSFLDKLDKDIITT